MTQTKFMWTYGKAFLVCVAAFLFGVWKHDIGGITGWLIASIAVLKLWAMEIAEAREESAK